MCYTGKCRHEDYWGECTWDWDQVGWPGGCLPTPEQEEEDETSREILDALGGNDQEN